MDRIPILRMGELLLVTIQVDMHDQLAMTLQDDLTALISASGARGVLIDISALDMVDSFIGRMLANIAQMSRVLDAQTVVTGMRPAVAITLVELGMTLAGVRTALTVDRGMAMLRQLIAAAGGGGEAPMSPQPGERPPAGEGVLPIGTSADVVQVRQAVRTAATALGFSLVDQTKIVTAASELARNTLEHGRGGTARIEPVTAGARRGLRLTFEDHGPGIPDVNLALTDGYTTGNGMGLGLSGSRRLVNEFDLVTKVGEGTRVTVTKWK